MRKGENVDEKSVFGAAARRQRDAAMAQEKNFELKLSHWVPASHPLQKALEDWGAAVEKESGGTVQIQGVPGSAARQGVRPLHMARDGIADVTYINPGYQPAVSRSSRRRVAVPDVGCQGRLDGARCCTANMSRRK